MGVEYFKPYPDIIPTLSVPKLHNVVTTASWDQIRLWLKKNAKAPFYGSERSSYSFETNELVTCHLVQFEDSDDAIMFALSFPSL